MRVEQVDVVSVPTCDVARSIAFYRDVLGLPESEYAEGLILHRRYAPRVRRGQG
jgi:catechol 2,3-dioxygenase-like lactoylglutathione lyase family enzyme